MKRSLARRDLLKLSAGVMLTATAADRAESQQTSGRKSDRRLSGIRAIARPPITACRTFSHAASWTAISISIPSRKRS